MAENLSSALPPGSCGCHIRVAGLHLMFVYLSIPGWQLFPHTVNRAVLGYEVVAERSLRAVSPWNPVLVVLYCSCHKYILKPVCVLCSCWQEEDAQCWEERRLRRPG